MCGPCNTAAAATAAAGTGFAIQLKNGSLVGRFNTNQQAEHVLRTTFKGAGKVVAR